MKKTILITGATDGIGKETAKLLAMDGHNILLHGRNPAKLVETEKFLSSIPQHGKIDLYMSDLSILADVKTFADDVLSKHNKIDALINNAGIYVTQTRETPEQLDTRFAVNTIAPYLLTKKLLPILGSDGRIINLSSAAQMEIDPETLKKPSKQMDGPVYAQSKLALTMWSHGLALSLDKKGPAIIAINPKSMLGTKMVKEAYGVNGHDLSIGAELLCRAALSEEFGSATGKYYDNDIEAFSHPHPDAINEEKCNALIDTIESILSNLGYNS